MSFNLKQINFRWGQRPFVALCLSFCLAFSGPVFALETGSTPIVTQPKPGKPIIPTKKDGEETKLPPDAIPSTLGSMQALVIPEAFGTIKEIFQGSQKETFVFHIQDVHASFEVQQNIAKIIDHINRTYFQDQIDLIAVEGAKGDVDLSLLKSVPDQEALKNTTHYLMREALMTGAEYYSTFYQKRAEVFGIEEGVLYFDNLQAFRDTIEQAEATQPLFQQFETSFYQLLDQMASPELKELYEKEAAYTHNKLSLSQFCLYLKELAQKYKLNVEVHPNFKTVLEAIALEKKMNFKQLEKEQSQLIQALQRLRVDAVTSSLIQKGLDYRTGKISAAQYYAFLLDLGQTKGLEPKQNYAELHQYNQLVQLQTQIKAPVLFKELDWVRSEIKSKMLTSKEETELDQIKEGFELLNDLRKLKLTRSQWQQFAQEKDDFDLNEWLDFMVAQANKRGLQLTPPSDLAALKKMFSAPERFYQDALARDHVIAENLFKELKSSNKKVAILITGGFHTEGLMQQIKAKDISYAVITPRMTEKYDDTLYLQRMMGERAALSLLVPWPNQLLKESNVPEELRKEVAEFMEVNTAITLGLITTELTEEQEEKLFGQWAVALEQNIRMNWDEKNKVFIIEYTSSDGKRMRRTVKNVPSDKQPIYFVVSKPQAISEEGGPVAFQAGLAPALVAEFGLTSGNVSSVKGGGQITKEKVTEFKEMIRQKSETVSVQGINLVVDQDLTALLKTAGLSFDTLLNQALVSEADAGNLIQNLQQQLQSRGETAIVVAMVDRSANVAENHLSDGLIAVNKSFLNALQPEATRAVFQAAFQTALVHELRHEANPTAGAEFETTQVAKDTVLFSELLSQAGQTPDINTFVTLTSLFDAGSPFLAQPVSRIARAFTLAKKNKDVEAALSEVRADLFLVDGVPNQDQVNLFSMLGALEGVLQSLQAPTLVLDVDQLKTKKQETIAYVNNLLKRFEKTGAPGTVHIYLTKGSALATEADLASQLLSRDFDVPNRVVFTPVPRDETLKDDQKYADQIAQQLKTNKEQDVRILTDNNEFYNALSVALAFVDMLFRNREAVTLRMSEAEYQHLVQALQALIQEGNAEAQTVLKDITAKVETIGGQKILRLSPEIIINSTYMDTLELARRTLAKQA